MTFSEWQSKYRDMRDRAERIAYGRTERARKLARESGGIDPSMPFMHAHNAMCGFNAGRPWRGVDYSKVRAILRLQQEVFIGHRILDRWCARVGVPKGSES